MSDVDRLILEAATGARQLSAEALRRVLEHVARAGFDPTPTGNARGLSGNAWQGRILRGSDHITAAERHYLRHVVVRHEWPDGTTLEDFQASLRAVILDERSGVFTSRYLQAGLQWRWQLGVMRRSGDLRGRGGSEWILIDYRVEIGHWTTAFQPQDGLRVLNDPGREDLRWLRRPR